MFKNKKWGESEVYILFIGLVIIFSTISNWGTSIGTYGIGSLICGIFVFIYAFILAADRYEER